MSTKYHLVGLAVCTVCVAAFEYIGLVWSFADFHPGSSPDLPDYLHRKAHLGSLMYAPFERPLRWLFGIVGDCNYLLVAVVQWLVLPLYYGVFIYSAYVVIRKRLLHAGRNV